MASVKGSANYVEFDEYVEYQLEKTRQGVKWTDVLAAAAGVAVLVLGYLLLFVVADHWIFEGGVPRSIRVGAFFVVLGISVIWLLAKAVWPFWRRVSDLYAAQMLERAEPSLRGHLLGLVDSRRGGRVPAEEVRRALEKRSATTLSDMDVDAALDRQTLMRIAYVLLALVVVVCAYAVFSPKRIGPSLVRAMIPGSSVSVATRTEILDVRPGDVTVLAGSQVDVSVRLRGETPEQVWLFYSTADRRFVDEPVEMRLVDEVTREYNAALVGDAGRGLTQDLTYRIEAGDAATQPFTVTVGQPPTATIDSITLEYPSYTEQRPETISRPPIEGVEGTRVSLEARANRPLKSAKIVFADDVAFREHGEEVPARISEDGLTLTADWTLAIPSDGSAPSFFRIEGRDRKGQSNPNPSVSPITIVPDEPPEITLHDPASDLEKPANAVVPLLVSANDPDYELREITLHIEKQGQPVPGRTVVWEGSDSSVKLRHEWPLEPLGLKPGDVVSFYLQARDNREPDANRRNTQKVNIRITEPVSEEQVQEQLAEDIQEQERQSEEAAAQPQPKPEGETGGGGDGEAGDVGDQESAESESENEQGGGESASEAPVKNDGSQDDQVLRELMEQQREEASREGETGKVGEEGAARGKDGASETTKQGQGETEGAKEGEKTGGETGESGQGETGTQSEPAGTKPGDHQSGGGSESGGNPGAEQSGGEGGSGSPNSPMGGSSGGRQGAEEAGTGEGMQPGGTGAGEGTADQPRNPTDGAGAEGGAAGDHGAGGDFSGDGSHGGEPTGSPGEESTESAAEETGTGQNNAPMNGAEDASGDAASREGDRQSEGDEASGETGGQETVSPGDPSATADETRRGQLDPSEQGDSIEQGSEAGGENGTDQPPSETRPAGENAQPGERAMNQRAASPDEGEGESGGGGAGKTPREGGENGGEPGQKNMEPAGQGGGASAANKSVTEENAAENSSDAGGAGEPREENRTEQSGAGQGEGGDAQSPNGQAEDRPAGGGQPGDGQTGNGQTGDEGAEGGAGGEGESAGDSSETGGAGQSQQGGESGGDQGGMGQPGEGATGQGQSGEAGTGQSGAGQSGNGQTQEGQTGDRQSGAGQAGQGQTGNGQSQEGGSPMGQGQGGENQSGGNSSGQGASGQGGAAGKGGQGAGSDPRGGTGGSGRGNGTGEMTEGNAAANESSLPDPANEDYAREAANLVLDRLEEDLQRGEVDPELLEQLGWSEEDMRKFAERLRSNLAEPTGEMSPEERAHRIEFEHMLENMSFQSEGTAREAATGRVREVEGVGEVSPSVPSEYREAYERFTRSVSGLRGEEGN